MSADQNWFGMDHHPTDSMVNWREVNPKALAAKLRSRYDLIVNTSPEHSEALRTLIQCGAGGPYQKHISFMEARADAEDEND